MKKYLYMILAASVTLFAACDGGETTGKGDDGDDDGNDNENKIEKVVKSITTHDGGKTVTDTYEYDDQYRVVSVSTSGASAAATLVTTFEYKDGLILEKFEDDDHASVTAYFLNSSNYVTRIESGYNEDDESYDSAWDISYTSDGYILKEKDDDDKPTIVDYVWENYLLKSVTTTYDNNSTYVSEMTYSNVKTHSNFDFNTLDYSDWGTVALMGYMGKVSDKLIATSSHTSDKETYSAAFRYETDKESYVVKIYSTEEEDGVADEETLWYTITYEEKK